MTRPRVLVLVKGLGLGGAERLVVESIAGDHSRRYDYEVAYVLPWKHHLVPLLERAGVRTTCIGGRRGSGLLAALWLLRHGRSYDLVHAHLPMTGILARICARRPVVYTEHNLADSYRSPTRQLNRVTYRLNAAVTAVSDAVAASLSAFPGPRPKVVVNGVAPDPELRSAADVRSELGLGDGQALIVHVGNIRPHKGHSTLIEAAAALPRTIDALIVSIGVEKYEGDLERLRRASAERGLGDLRFLGPRDDARSFIAAADLFVNPADVEGLPVAILEAMTAGTPVVATAVGGVPSVIREEDTGRLVPSGDPQALATAIAEALEEHETTREMARRAKELVDTEYSVARMTREFEATYDDVLA